MNTKSLHEYTETYIQFMREAKNNIIVDYNLLDKLHGYEVSLHRLAEAACDRELTQKEETRVLNLESKVHEIAALLGFKEEFNSDPRGAYIKFLLPSGRSNNWDGKSWRIYW